MELAPNMWFQVGSRGQKMILVSSMNGPQYQSIIFGYLEELAQKYIERMKNRPIQDQEYEINIAILKLTANPIFDFHYIVCLWNCAKSQEKSRLNKTK